MFTAQINTSPSVTPDNRALQNAIYPPPFFKSLDTLRIQRTTCYNTSVSFALNSSTPVSTFATKVFIFVPKSLASQANVNPGNATALTNSTTCLAGRQAAYNTATTTSTFTAKTSTGSTPAFRFVTTMSTGATEVSTYATTRLIGGATTSIGITPVKTDVVPVEPGVAPVKAGVVPIKTGVAPVEAGIAPVDTGIVPVKTGVLPVEAGVVPIETDVAPVENFVAPVETDVAFSTAFCLPRGKAGELQVHVMQKINLIAPNPKGSKLIFFTPFRVGAIEENHHLLKHFFLITNKSIIIY